MLIKAADDKTERLRLLEDLQSSPKLDAKQKDWLAKELRNTKQGIKGEKSAAHYLDNHLAASKNFMVIHDLRISVEGEVAQIDHLLIGRAFFILMETKTFGGDIAVNERGEFSVQYPGERVYDIPSPLEQSRRHENVLQKLLERLEIRPRTGGRHRMEHVVLVDPTRAVRRPGDKRLDTSYLVKADQFPDWHKKWADKDPGLLEVLQPSLISAVTKRSKSGPRRSRGNTDRRRFWSCPSSCNLAKNWRKLRRPAQLVLRERVRPREAATQ
jgi:hypothetical protein